MTVEHRAVLLQEAVEALNIHSDGNYVDATFGRGGHSRQILTQLGPGGCLIAIDRDRGASLAAQAIHDPRFTFIQGPFSEMENYLSELSLVGKIDGILMDLGVSSPQLDEAERGFSFMRDGPLDMRMDTTSGITASEWLCHTTEEELAWVLKTLGEERFAKRIAKAIVRRNQIEKITRTAELAQIIATAMPFKSGNKHPATRSFQAIRMYINRELEEIEAVLRASEYILAPQGRLAIISFHSLEDRKIKQFMATESRGHAIPVDLPLTVAQLHSLSDKRFKLLGKKKATAAEIASNPRARSAILRVAARL